MKPLQIFFLCVLLAPFTLAHIGGIETTAGPYSVVVGSMPEQLAPGPSTLLISILKDNHSVAYKDVWVRLAEKDTVYFAGTLRTDASGTASMSYLFNGPGLYDFTVEVEGNRATVPLHVHGEYILLFGFLAAIFIVVALLFGKL